MRQGAGENGLAARLGPRIARRSPTLPTSACRRCFLQPEAIHQGLAPTCFSGPGIPLARPLSLKEEEIEMTTSLRLRPRAAFLVVLMLGLAMAPSPTASASVPDSHDLRAAPRASLPAGVEADREQDLRTVRRLLEAEAVRERLRGLGLSPEEADRRLERLSDDQLHRLASQIDSLIPGGNVDGTLRTILTVMLIVLVAILIVILV
jgi:hypothetical protein